MLRNIRFIRFIELTFLQKPFSNLIFINFFPVLISIVFFNTFNITNPSCVFEIIYFKYMPLSLVILNFLHSWANRQYSFNKNILLLLGASVFEILIYLIKALFVKEEITYPPDDFGWGFFIGLSVIKVFYAMIYAIIAKIILAVERRIYKNV